MLRLHANTIKKKLVKITKMNFDYKAKLYWQKLFNNSFVLGHSSGSCDR